MPSVAPIGIDDLNLYASATALDFPTLAKARGLSQKVLQQTGFLRRSVLPSFEDPVTLAVNAAKPLLDVKHNIGLLIVATESGLDYGKPISSYIHKYLDLPISCRNFEIKHACYAGTAALHMACSWISHCSDERLDRHALVILTDVPRLCFRQSWEITMGAGAIALSIKKQPRILEIDPITACAAREVYDVRRPTSTSEFMDPVLSISSYLDLIEVAWEEFCRVSTRRSIDNFSYALYHAPLVSLVQRAHEIVIQQCTTARDLNSFHRMVEPSLLFNKEVGNIYSGSLYASLAGLVDAISPITTPTPITLFSYGSGACAEFFSGVLRPEASDITRKRHILERLSMRKQLTVDEYEKAEEEIEQSLSARNYSPSSSRKSEIYKKSYEGKQLLVLDDVRDFYRQYMWS